MGSNGSWRSLRNNWSWNWNELEEQNLRSGLRWTKILFWTNCRSQISLITTQKKNQLEVLDSIYELANENHLNYRDSTRFTVTIVDPELKDADIYANHKSVEEGLSDEQMMINTLNNKNLSPNEADVIVFPFENVI